MAYSPAKNKISVSSSYPLSSSSPSMPSRPNPKPRNSETGDPMRRSFRGSPFPVESSRRNSIGDKENKNEVNLISNVVKVSKGGSKNFMSPTISAVSKINPSPKKKILSEKNELSRSFDKTLNHQVQVRSSVSFSDVISIIGEDKDDDVKTQLDDDVTVTDFNDDLEKKRDDDDSRFKISPLPPSVPSTFRVLESPELDPLVAPYDPKKNYLSPRPQFLHYKPNPRIEQHFDECKQLEELFVSETSSSETDLSAEESQQEEEVGSQEGGAVAVEEEVKEIQDKDGDEHLEAAEIDAEIDEEEEEMIGESIEEVEETPQISKQSRFKMSKLLVWILALGVVSMLLVSSTTYSQSNIIKDLPFHQFHISPEIIMSAREIFEQLSVKLRVWSESSLVYLEKMISSLQEEEGYGSARESFEHLSVKLRMWSESSLVYLEKLISSLREEVGFGALQFHNLTDLWDDRSLSDTVFQPTSVEISVPELLVDSHGWGLDVDMGEENDEPEEPENSGEMSLEADYEDDGSEVGQESEGGEEANSEMVNEFNKIATDTDVSGGEGYSKPLSEDRNGGQETDGVEGQIEHEEYDQKNIEEAESAAHHLDDVESTVTSGHQQVETEVTSAETVQEEGIGETAGKSLDVSAEATDVELDGTGSEEESGYGEVVNVADSEEGLLSNQKKVIVLFSTLMVLLAAAAGGFLLAKKKTKPVMLQQHEDDEPTTITEHVSVENLIKERLSTLNLNEEADDDRKGVEVSSFPSEMSFSFSKNRSLHNCSNSRESDLKKYQSGGGSGKKSNDSGESMASSASEYSIGSVSYGSFTTYEKIQKRSGRKEKEMVTPVRRSSRIRNHQHSGQ